MLKQEEIKLNTKKLGTVIKYFTNFSAQTEDSEIAYLLQDASGGFRIVESSLDIVTKRNTRNNFISHSGDTIFEGFVIIEQKNLLNNESKKSIKEKYESEILQQYLQSSEFLTLGNTNNLKTFVEFKDVEVDDMYINIELNRSIDHLDTLNIYNAPINEPLEQTSNTGILFGRLLAIQNIEDENGNKVIIPLKNTIVAIFNPSELYPNTSSLDENGNRISLNIKENIAVNLSNNYSPYFNEESYKTDYQFLKDTSQIKNIPEMYKYTAITNENGEFILHNVPIGEQTLMYEVNLLKQGLTPDEVALNFFSYPLEPNPNIDKVPHYFFRQIPINIVPSWGVFQTGYTEVNIKVNLDLRKWCTYTISPIAYKQKTIEEMFADGITTPISVDIRDMTKKLDVNFLPKVEVVEIQDIYDRNYDQVSEWNNEFKQKKNKVEFRSTNFNYFKLPANLYDPNGINTKGEKGVWLASYQFKMYYGNKTSSYKATGFEREWFPNKPLGRNHFDLNKNANYGDDTIDVPIGKLGVFPYEKPWTINYPEKYKIPSIPSILNSNKKYEDIGNGNFGNALIPEEPIFLDGDLTGKFIDISIESSGYGKQNIGGEYTINQFAREVTTHGVYKYEENINWGEQYSNGYTPVIDQSNLSQVVNGERWQRLECGYIYWMRPEGWPRTTTYGGYVDILSDGDQTPTVPPTSLNWGPNSYAEGIYKSRENILIRMDASAPWWNIGALDIYKIVDPKKIASRIPPPQEKFIELNLQDLIGEIERGGTHWLAVASVKTRQFFRVSNAGIVIKNKGTNKVEITVGSKTATIEPNAEFDFTDSIQAFSKIKFPSNSSFDASTNSYNNAKYEITMWSIQNDVLSGGLHEINKGNILSGGQIEFDKMAGFENNIPQYYLVQIIPKIVSINGVFSGGNPKTSNMFGQNLVAIYGFAYCLYSPLLFSNSTTGNFIFAKPNNLAFTYWPGHPVYTPNPYMYILDKPLPIVAVTDNGGNYPYGFIDP